MQKLNTRLLNNCWLSNHSRVLRTKVALADRKRELTVSPNYSKSLDIISLEPHLRLKVAIRVWTAVTSALKYCILSLSIIHLSVLACIIISPGDKIPITESSTWWHLLLHFCINRLLGASNMRFFFKNIDKFQSLVSYGLSWQEVYKRAMTVKVYGIWMRCPCVSMWSVYIWLVSHLDP